MTLKDSLRNPFILGLLLFFWISLLGILTFFLTAFFLTNSNALLFFSIIFILALISIIAFGSLLASLSGQPLPLLTRIKMCLIGCGLSQILNYASMYRTSQDYATLPIQIGSGIAKLLLNFGFILAITVILFSFLTFLGERLYFALKR